MQHEETAAKPQEEKGLAGMSAVVFAALLAVAAHGVWWSAAQADITKEAGSTVKLRSASGTREISLSGGAGKSEAAKGKHGEAPQKVAGAVPAVKTALPAAPEATKAAPEAAKVENAWEWRWHGRLITVDQVILNSEKHKPVQEWAKANTLVLKVKLDPAEELIGVTGSFAYDGKLNRQAVKTTVNPGGEPGEFMVSISGQAPEGQPEKITFALNEILVRSSKPATYKLDWKKYRIMTTDGDGRTLVNLEEQQPHKIYDAELRLTHLYYGNSMLYLTVEVPAELKAPYMFPVAVDKEGLVVTNEKGEVSPGVVVQSGVTVAEGTTATTIELGRNNFTDAAAMLNIQVAKIGAKLVIAEEVPVK